MGLPESDPSEECALSASGVFPAGLHFKDPFKPIRPSAVRPVFGVSIWTKMGRASRASNFRRASCGLEKPQRIRGRGPLPAGAPRGSSGCGRTSPGCLRAASLLGMDQFGVGNPGGGSERALRTFRGDGRGGS